MEREDTVGNVVVPVPGILASIFWFLKPIHTFTDAYRDTLSFDDDCRGSVATLDLNAFQLESLYESVHNPKGPR
jgi:hypothetical protein